MPPRKQSARPDELPAKKTRPTRTAAANKKTTAAATKQAGANSLPPKPKPKARSRAASTNPGHTKPAKTQRAAFNPTSTHGPPASEPPEEDSPAEEADVVAAPSPAPSYHPQVVVKGNNILLSGPWNVRKYSNDFENDKERLELDRLKAALVKRSPIPIPTRREPEQQTSGLNEDSEEPDHDRDLERDDDSDPGDPRYAPAKPYTGKKPVDHVDHTQRFAVKHKDHGGGIFDPSVEAPLPMPRDPRYQYGQHHKNFTEADGTVADGWLVPQPGIPGAWHFKCFGKADSDNMVASELMGSKGYFDPDTEWPTASDVQAYRDYLRTYEDIEPKIHDPTEPINIIWKPLESGSNPHGLRDGPDDHTDSSDGSDDDADQDIDRDACGVDREQDSSRLGFRFADTSGGHRSQQHGNGRNDIGSISSRSMLRDDQERNVVSASMDAKAADTTQSLRASMPGHQPAMKRKSLAATTKQPSETSFDDPEEQSPPKRARRSGCGENGSIAHEDDWKERFSLGGPTASGPTTGEKSVKKAQRGPCAKKKSLADQAIRRNWRSAEGALGSSVEQSVETSELMPPGEFTKLYGKTGFR